LFSELGFNGVTTKALAKRAGVTEKTLFHYFPSKRALYEEVLHHRLLAPLERSAGGRIRNIQSLTVSLKDKLLVIVADLLEYLYNNGPALSLVAQELILNKDFRAVFLAAWTRQQRETYVSLIRESQRSGELRNLSEEAVFEMLMSLTLGHGISQMLFASTPSEDVTAEAALIVDVFLNGIRRRP